MDCSSRKAQSLEIKTVSMSPQDLCGMFWKIPRWWRYRHLPCKLLPPLHEHPLPRPSVHHRATFPSLTSSSIPINPSPSTANPPTPTSMPHNSCTPPSTKDWVIRSLITLGPCRQPLLTSAPSTGTPNRPLHRLSWPRVQVHLKQKSSHCHVHLLVRTHLLSSLLPLHQPTISIYNTILCPNPSITRTDLGILVQGGWGVNKGVGKFPSLTAHSVPLRSASLAKSEVPAKHAIESNHTISLPQPAPATT